MNGYGRDPGAIGPYAPEVMGINRANRGESWSEPIETRLDRLIGVLERHRAERYGHALLQYSSPSGITTVGTVLAYAPGSTRLEGVLAWTLFVDNPSGYLLREKYSSRYIPPTTYNYPLLLGEAQGHVELSMVGGSDANSTLIVVLATEDRVYRW